MRSPLTGVTATTRHEVTEVASGKRLVLVAFGELER